MYLKCDLHVHTSLSDGELTVREVVDLYGFHRFDAICITDHVWDTKTIKDGREPVQGFPGRDWDGYIEGLRIEREYAWAEYEMLLIPGLEVTNNTRQYHILAIDVKKCVSPDNSVPDIIEQIQDQQALAIAAHPGQDTRTRKWDSKYLWDFQDTYRNMFDAWEVANRDDLYSFTSIKKNDFKYIASSDFHKDKHIYSWKTMVRGDKNEESIKAAIKHNLETYIYLYRKPTEDQYYSLPDE